MKLLKACKGARSLVLVLILAGCEASQQSVEHISIDETPVPGYRLVIMVRDFDYAQTNGGTLFTIHTPNGQVVASAGFPRTWNSYCANDARELHFFTRSAGEPSYTRDVLPKPDAALKTAYTFTTNNTLYVEDRGNGRQFQIDFDDGELLPMVQVTSPDESPVICPPFVARGQEYRWTLGRIQACPLESGEECDSVAIDPRTFPYVFAEHDGRVVAVTNWGDALIHGDDGWCRADFVDGWYACPLAGTPLLPIPVSNRGLQFYSSIRYENKTYLGRWPDGLLYEFDGNSIVLSADSPPSAEYYGSEAQSLAIYCGDLFLGRWPRGTVWTRDLETSTWRRLERLFSHPSDAQPWIPYLGQEPEGVPWAFLGQRVTSLTPFADSLVAATSNLRSWHEEVSNPDFLTAQEIAEYGAIHRIHRPGCLTTWSPRSPRPVLSFEFYPSEIRVRYGSKILAAVQNDGVLPRAEDVVSLGEGVFGTLRGAWLKGWVQIDGGPWRAL